MEPVRLRLGELLVDARIITREQLEAVLEIQKSDGRRLGTLMVERELVNETQLTQILSQQLSVPWVSLYHVDFSKRLLNLVPAHVAQEYSLVPIYVRHVRGQGDTLYVAMDDPTNVDALRECASWSGLPTRAMISSPADIRRAIEVYYGVTMEEPWGKARAIQEPPEAVDDDLPDSDAEQASDLVAGVEEDAAVEQLAKDDEEQGQQAAAEVVGGDVDEAALAQDEAEDGELPGEEVAEPESHELPEREPTRSSVAPAAEQLNGTREGESLVPLREVHEVQVDADAPPAVETTGSHRSGDVEHEETPGGQQRREDDVVVEVGEEMSFDELLAQQVSEGGASGSEAEPKFERPKPRRLLSLTLLDGTTLALPVRPKKKPKESLVGSFQQQATRARRKSSERPSNEVVDEHLNGEDGLSVRDVIAALRAAAHGVDSSESLGRHAKWEAMVAAILAILVRKGVVTEEELLDEMRRI